MPKKTQSLGIFYDTITVKRILHKQSISLIAVRTTPLFDTFRVDGDARVGGLLCHNRLEALQRIMEHEMLHLAELLLFRDSNCSATPFKNSALSNTGAVMS